MEQKMDQFTEQLNQIPPGFTPIKTDGTTEEYFVNMGPQHPSTHGAFRLQMRLDGETVREIVPHMGYIHRGIEKMGEECTYIQYIHLTDRQDYLTSNMNNIGVCMAIEKAMGIGLPERAEYIRVIMAELQRISSHLVFLGAYGADVGGLTSFLYGFKEREVITDLFEEVCGARLTMNFFRPGGSISDVPETFIPKVKQIVENLKHFLDEWDRFLSGNIIFQERNRGIGILPKEKAIEFSCTGPMVRGSGVDFDLRKQAPYGIYDQFDFTIPVGSTGDCFDRYLIRVEEVVQSLKILEQAVAKFPEGPYRAKELPSYRLPKGTYMSQYETAKGVYGTYIVAEKGDKPYRIKTRSPSFANLQALNYMCQGHKVADVVAILGTVDPVIPEVDR